MEKFEYYISGVLMASVSITENDYSVFWIENKLVEETDNLPGFPLDNFIEILFNVEMNLCKDYVQWKEYNFQKNGKFCREGRETVLWKDVNCTHGALDLLVDGEDIVGGLFTNGQATTYLIKHQYIDCSPLKEWEHIRDTMRPLGEAEFSYVLTGDGVKLGTRVWLPKDCNDGETFPTLLIRTPYNSLHIGYFERLAATRGYAVVVQDVRGRYSSEGEFIAEYYEKQDGKATLDWIKKQSWYGGRIGVIGASYLGYTSWATLASGDKDLTAAVSLVTAGSPFYGDADRKNGAYSSTCMLWDVMMSDGADGIDPESAEIVQMLKTLPIGEIDRRIIGCKSKTWETFMSHADFDDFWKEIGLEQHGKNIDVPTLYITGYHEGCIGGTIEVWEMCQKYGRKNQHLICGPWFHDFNGNRRVLKEALSSDSVLYNLDLLYAKWFDYWMLGKDKIEIPTLTAYVEGQNSWVYRDNWKEKTSNQTYYLSENKKLTVTPQKEQTRDQYFYNPMLPTEQLYEEDEYMVPIDYQEQEKRSDMLIYTTPPFECRCKVFGTPKVHLYASSTAKDTDFVVRLNFVNDKGESRAMASMIQRAKYRNSYETPELLEPGRVYQYEFSLPWVGRTIKKGYCIRLEICSAAAGDFFPNLNTGNDPKEDFRWEIAEQTVFSGGETPSRIILPIEKEE